MPAHLAREIENLKNRVLTLSTLAEESVEKAVRALDTRDEQLALLVKRGDADIDRMEVDIEEDCLKVLALYQPVAVDLRFIIAMLKINTDLERIGDLAANIADRGEYLATHTPTDAAFSLSAMASKARAMLRNSLTAFMDRDADLARSVCAADDEVDDLLLRIYADVGDALRHRPNQLDSITRFYGASHDLERIADHATNIAEDVLYMLEGQIVRHDVTKVTGRKLI
jgi:phosphate transport system protein